MEDDVSAIHNKYAPFWALTFLIFLLIGLSTIWFDLGPFWKGYVLDMVGPAWTYILFRGLFTQKANNFWTRFFTPRRTFFIILVACFGIELLQYFKVYSSTFDFWDFGAYSSLLLLLHLIDRKQDAVSKSFLSEH